VGSALIASVTFTGWLQPPLGVQPNFNYPSKDLAAPPGSFLSFAVVDGNSYVKIFFICDGMSFFFSIWMIMHGTTAVAMSYKFLVIGYMPHNMRFRVLGCFVMFFLAAYFLLFAFFAAGLAIIPPDAQSIIKYVPFVLSLIPAFTLNTCLYTQVLPLPLALWKYV
jgi:hypothetical protein